MKNAYFPQNVSPEPFSTSDLGTAAAVLTKGFRFLGVERREDAGRCYFLFERGTNGDVERTAQDYLSNRLRLPCRAFYESLKNLKGAIFRS